MSAESNPLPDPTPKPLNQLVAELFRENERLSRQVDDARYERDQYKKLYLGALARTLPELTEEDIANAVPAEPIIEAHIRRLEGE